MLLNWKNYDEYFNDPRDQQQIDDSTKLDIERIAAAILQLDTETLSLPWGACSAPGVFAQTVVRVDSTIQHRFTGVSQNKTIGLKIFKKGKEKHSRKLVNDHKHSRNKLPGLPNELVQDVYAADEHNGTFFLVQDWVKGESLENFLKSETPISMETALRLLNDLFEGIIIPLWSTGTIWWDIRAGNFCVTERDGKQRLVLIDTDSLLAYADEIIETPLVFTRRDKGKIAAMKRIKTIVTDLALAQFSESYLKGKRSSLEKKIRTIAGSSLIAFDSPGCLIGGGEAFQTLIDRIELQVWPIKATACVPPTSQYRVRGGRYR
jgi:hypothetical protein